MPNSRLLSMPDVPLSNPNADVSQLPSFGTAIPGLSWMDRLRFIRWLILSIGAEHTHQAEDCERFAKQGRHVRYPLFIED